MARWKERGKKKNIEWKKYISEREKNGRKSQTELEERRKIEQQREKEEERKLSKKDEREKGRTIWLGEGRRENDTG